MAVALDRARGWGVSIGTHVALLAALAFALGSGHHHDDHDPTPARLVWVEPAPAPRIAAPAPVPEPVAPAPPPSATVPEPAPRTEAKPAAPRAPVLTQRETRPRPRIEQRRSVPPQPDAAESAVAPAPAAAIVPGREGGVATGIPGGAAGGLGDAPLPLSAVASPPDLVERVLPEYPARARQLEVEGQVLLEVVLDQHGRPEQNIRVLKSIAMLDAAAISAVRQWRFRPARDASGRPVRVVMEVPVRFMLR
jgi:protein TonB